VGRRSGEACEKDLQKRKKGRCRRRGIGLGRRNNSIKLSISKKNAEPSTNTEIGGGKGNGRGRNFSSSGTRGDPFRDQAKYRESPKFGRTGESRGGSGYQISKGKNQCKIGRSAWAGVWESTLRHDFPERGED